MKNLEWIRTLSAKELSDLLYDYWLPRGQYVWTDSRKGLVKMLGETYLERDCDKCKHQGNCYCVKGLGCPFESKTEPTISKMEQVDKDINVRSNYEPQTDIHGITDCDFCKHESEEWDSEACDGCCNANNHFEPKDEPQTEYDKYREKIRAHDTHKDWFEGEPQTDCAQGREK